VDVEHFGFLSSSGSRKRESHEQDGETLGANGAPTPASGDPAMAFILPFGSRRTRLSGALRRRLPPRKAGMNARYSARGKTARESTQRRMPSFSMMLL
jgi:hypothetical protein